MSGERARITPYRDGPLIVRGPFTLVDQDGREIDVHQDTIALCRCGRSARKPFCDGMHKAVRWSAPSGVEAQPCVATSGRGADGQQIGDRVLGP